MSLKFIFEIRVADDKDEEFIENWHKMSIPIQEYDGAMGTRLHKKQGEDTYIAIGRRGITGGWGNGHERHI